MDHELALCVDLAHERFDMLSELVFWEVEEGPMVLLADMELVVEQAHVWSSKNIENLSKIPDIHRILQPSFTFLLVVPYRCLVNLVVHYLVAWSWAPFVYDFS